MKKRWMILLSLGIALVAGAAGALVLLASEVEKGFDAVIARWDADEYITVKKVEYKRSWWGAEAISEVGLEGMPLSLRFRHEIVYPPVARGGIVEVNTMMETPPGSVIAPLFGTRAPLVAKTVFQWDGSATTRFSSPPFTSRTQGLGQIRWNGVQGEFHAEGEHVHVVMKMPGLKTAGGLIRLGMNNVVLDVDGTQSGDGVWLGGVKFEMDSFEGFLAHYGALAFKGVRLAQSLEEGSPGMLRIDVSADAREIAMDEGQVTGVGYEMEISHLDRAAASALARRVGKKIDRLLSPEQAVALAVSAKGDILKLLSRSPRVTVKRMRFTLPQGSFRGNASAELSSPEEIDENDPSALLEPLRVVARVEIGKPLFAWIVQQEMREPARMIGNSGKERSRLTEEQVDQLARAMSRMRIARWERAGVLVNRSGTYSIDLDYEHAQLTLNGSTIENLTDFMDPD